MAQWSFNQENHKANHRKIRRRLLFGGYPELMQSDWEEKKSIYLK
jgi:hypothetical protein